MINSNRIEIVYDDKSIFVDNVPGINIVFVGSNNHIKINHNTKFANCRFKIHSHNKIIFEETKYIVNNLAIFANSNTHVFVGRNFSCLSCEMRCQENNVGIEIGDDCMLSTEILFYPTDGHAIYTIDKEEVINKGNVIKVGNHVWIGRRVCLLKGATIAENCVIGLGSVVTKRFDQKNSIIAGYPARIIKEGINWDRVTPDVFERELEKRKNVLPAE